MKITSIAVSMIGPILLILVQLISIRAPPETWHPGSDMAHSTVLDESHSNVANLTNILTNILGQAAIEHWKSFIWKCRYLNVGLASIEHYMG